MSGRLPWFCWALCFLPLACSSKDGSGAWSGAPSPSGAAPTDNNAASGSSSGTPTSGVGAVTGLSSSSGGGTPASGNTGSSGGGGHPAGSSSGSPQSGSGSSGGAPLGGSVDGGTTTQSKTVPDLFADAGAYSPPAEAGSGEHHPGESCMQSGCHDGSGPQAPEPFTIAGTVFKDYAGTIAYPGVEVVVQDATGRIRTTYSHTNGNFYMGGGALALPATVAARDSTTTRPMVTQLTTAGMASCASAGCHIIGGSPSTGAYYPIHIP